MKIDVDYIHETLKHRIQRTQKKFDETGDDYFLALNIAYKDSLDLIEQQIKIEKGDYIV